MASDNRKIVRALFLCIKGTCMYWRDASKVVNDRWHFRPLTRAKMVWLPRGVYVIRCPLLSNLDDARKLCHFKPLS